LSFSQRLTEIRTGFEPAFWVANISELFERLCVVATTGEPMCEEFLITDPEIKATWLRLQVTKSPRLALCFLWLFLFPIRMACSGFGYAFTEGSILSCFFVAIVKW